MFIQEQSINAFNHAKAVIPGGVNSPVRAFKAVGGTPPFIERGEGAYLYDIDGYKYIDYVQSWGPLIFGHADKDIETAVIEAAKKGLSFGAPTLGETALAKEIMLDYEGLDRIRLVSSGTEAVMSAIRLARGYTGKEDIIKFEGCYHGHSDSLLVKAGSGATTFGVPSSPGAPKDLVKHTLLAEYNDIESVKKHFTHNHNIACIIIEPVAGNMGFVPAKKEFLQALRVLCDEHSVVLIFDEVMSGFRCALGGAQEVYGVIPDIATFGKVIGGGMPIGAFGGRLEIMRHLAPDGGVYQAGTLSGNPVSVAAGLSMLKKIKKDKNLYKTLEAKALKLVNGMKDAANKHGIPLQVGAIGSMFGFFFNDKPVYSYADALTSNTELFGKFHGACIERGVYFACSQFEAGFMCTAITDELIDETIEKVDDAFLEIKSGGG